MMMMFARVNSARCSQCVSASTLNSFPRKLTCTPKRPDNSRYMSMTLSSIDFLLPCNPDLSIAGKLVAAEHVACGLSSRGLGGGRTNDDETHRQLNF